MGGYDEDDLNLDLTKYYATRDKLTHLDEINEGTAFTKAYEKGYLEIVKCLLAAGADKDKASYGGYTPLIGAAIQGHVEIARLLLAAGAKKNKVTSDGNTALSYATSGGHQDIVQLLQLAD